MACCRCGAAAAGQGRPGGQWAELSWGMVVGLQLSLASYTFGEQCAKIADRFLTGDRIHQTITPAVMHASV